MFVFICTACNHETLLGIHDVPASFWAGGYRNASYFDAMTCEGCGRMQLALATSMKTDRPRPSTA